MEITTNKQAFKHGYSLAQNLAKNESEYQEKRLTLFIKVATLSAQHGVDYVNATLEGYAQFYADNGASDGTCRARKAELNAVCKAILNTEITETFMAQAKEVTNLQDLIALARRINKPVTTENGGDKTPPTQKLRASQIDNMHENLKRADVIQIADFIETASQEFNKPHADAQLVESKQFKLIGNVAYAMSENEAYDKVTRNIARQILALANRGLELHDKAMQEAQKAAETMAEQQKVVNE